MIHGFRLLLMRELITVANIAKPTDKFMSVNNFCGPIGPEVGKNA